MKARCPFYRCVLISSLSSFRFFGALDPAKGKNRPELSVQLVGLRALPASLVPCAKSGGSPPKVNPTWGCVQVAQNLGKPKSLLTWQIDPSSMRVVLRAPMGRADRTPEIC